LKRVVFLDTTLRDGEQTPGFGFNTNQKVECALLLDRLRIDRIEVGFPAASQVDAEALRILSRRNLSSTLVALARARKEDIDLALDNGAQRATIFIPFSDLLLRTLIGRSREEVLKLALDALAYALSKKVEVEVFLADAMKTEASLLVPAVEKLSDAGASTVVLADTTGVTYPSQVKRVFTQLGNIRSELGVHFHNDLGLATANSLAALENGATEVHATVGGLGERAGNTSLEEIAVAAHLFIKDISANVDLGRLYETTLKVAETLRYDIPSNKPVIGRRVFTHESDIHVASILQDKSSFEAFPPELIGRTHEVVFGKLSGRRGIGLFLKENDLELSDQELTSLVSEVKAKTMDGGFFEPAELLNLARQYAERNR